MSCCDLTSIVLFGQGREHPGCCKDGVWECWPESIVLFADSPVDDQLDVFGEVSGDFGDDIAFE